MSAPHPDIERLVSLDGRVALVAGGGGSIGSAVATLFQRAGATVIVADRPGVEPPPAVVSFPSDLAESVEVTDLFERIERGFPRLDIIVHAAGIARDAVLWKMDPEAWRDVMRVNLDSAFHLLRDGIPRLRSAGGGSVILVSSINGERGKFGQSNYAASKAGLIGLARTAAREAGSFGVRVNVIAPGMIRSAMTEHLPEAVREQARGETALGHLGEPLDVAGAALFLASDLSRHVTGQVLRVDGGQLIA